MWGNDHTDPGVFPIARCLAMARGGSTPVPRPSPATPKPKPTEGDDDMQDKCGCWYYPNPKDKKTRVYMIFDTSSGFCDEFSNGAGRGALPASYVNPIAKGLGTKPWFEVTSGHAKRLKADLEKVRKGV
ncbi:MAG: hypothetical protein R5N81_09540 [Cutibacterium granulosum]|nr:hypothetical protein [Cutibacterium granulosum]